MLGVNRHPPADRLLPLPVTSRQGSHLFIGAVQH